MTRHTGPGLVAVLLAAVVSVVGAMVARAAVGTVDLSRSNRAAAQARSEWAVIASRTGVDLSEVAVVSDTNAVAVGGRGTILQPETIAATETPIRTPLPTRTPIPSITPGASPTATPVPTCPPGWEPSLALRLEPSAALPGQQVTAHLTGRNFGIADLRIWLSMPGQGTVEHKWQGGLTQAVSVAFAAPSAPGRWTSRAAGYGEVKACLNGHLIYQYGGASSNESTLTVVPGPLYIPFAAAAIPRPDLSRPISATPIPSTPPADSLLYWDFENHQTVGDISTAVGTPGVTGITGFASQTGGGPAEWLRPFGWVHLTRSFGPVREYPYLDFVATDPMYLSGLTFSHVHNHNFYCTRTYRAQLQIDTGGGYADIGDPLLLENHLHGPTSVNLNLDVGPGTYRLRWEPLLPSGCADTGTDFYGLSHVSLNGRAIDTTPPIYIPLVVKYLPREALPTPINAGPTRTPSTTPTPTTTATPSPWPTDDGTSLFRVQGFVRVGSNGWTGLPGVTVEVSFGGSHLGTYITDADGYYQSRVARLHWETFFVRPLKTGYHFDPDEVRGTHFGSGEEEFHTVDFVALPGPPSPTPTYEPYVSPTPRPTGTQTLTVTPGPSPTPTPTATCPPGWEPRLRLWLEPAAVQGGKR